MQFYFYLTFRSVIKVCFHVDCHGNAILFILNFVELFKESLFSVEGVQTFFKIIRFYKETHVDRFN